VNQLVRSRSVFLAVAAVAFGVLLAPAGAWAQTTAPAAPAEAAPAPAAATIPPVIGILDTEAVVLGSTAGKSLTQQANALLKQLQDASQKQEDALVAQAKALDAKRSANPPISQADYVAQRQQLQGADDKIRSDFDKNHEALNARVDKARQSLLQAASKVIQDVAKARGLNLVIARTSLTLFPEQWNITNDVVARLNKALPGIKL
jgi:Skp family chaperone for outer membrane proteins